MADDEHTQKMRGRLLVVLAAVMWSTSGFFAKAPFFADWPMEHRGTLLAFWRALFAAVILVPLVRKPKWHWALVPMVALFVTMNYVYLSALVYTTAANSIWLQNTAPVWVFLAGVFALGEKASPRDWLLLVFCTLGVGLILFFEVQGQQMKGIVFGLLAGITYGGVILALRYLRDVESAWLIALNHIVTAAVFFPYVVYQGIWPDTQQTVALAGFGMLQMGLPYFLFARGLRVISGHEAAGIALLEPILVPLWVYLAWHNEASYQAPRWWTFVGGGLIMTGLVLRYLATVRRKT
jgi:drug/metabolite transporter (DMT)-like permease